MAQLGDQRVGALYALHKCDIGIDSLSLDIMRIADNSGFSDLWMGDKRGFDLGGSHAVARHIQNIIHAPGDPEIAVFIAARTIAREIATREGGEIGFNESLMVTIDGPHLPRP